MNNLFTIKKENLFSKYRPTNFEEIYGHQNIKNSLKNMKEKNKLMNILFYGSSGTGKTTIANVISKEFSYTLYTLNASKLTKDELFETIKRAKLQEKSIIFIDEIHRLNKLQQDYLLDDAENSNIIIIGATTENPYGSINNALLSRMIVYKLDKLNNKNIRDILYNISLKENIVIKDDILDYLVDISNGDARFAINNLELLILNDMLNDDINTISKILIRNNKRSKSNYISAFIKSIRGSDIDASIYWLAAMLKTDFDIEYIARRMVILASEDIGLANPTALMIANSCLQSIKEIGMPEARIILSETAIYLAMSPKSNSSYLAIDEALNYIDKNGIEDVPIHLTKNFSNKYLYPHSFENNYVKQKYMNNDKTFFKFQNNKTEINFKNYLIKIKGVDKN